MNQIADGRLARHKQYAGVLATHFRPADRESGEVGHVQRHKNASHPNGSREHLLVGGTSKARVNDVQDVYTKLAERADERIWHLLVEQQRNTHGRNCLRAFVTPQFSFDFLGVVVPVTQRVIDLRQSEVRVQVLEFFRDTTLARVASQYPHWYTSAPNRCGTPADVGYLNDVRMFGADLCRHSYP